MKHIWNRIQDKIKRSQLGAATIEAIISFTGFLFVIFTILNIVNFCRAQMLISNAMDTVTKELSQYSYFYQISGLQKFDQEIQAIGEEGAISLNNVASSMGDLYNALGTAVSSSEEEMRGLTNSLQEGTLTSASVSTALQDVKTNGTNVLASMERLEAQFEDVADNPVLYLKSIVAVAGSEGLETAKSHVIAAPLAKSLLVKHFGDTRVQASAELERLGVVDGLDGMKFGMSTIFTREHPDEIHLVVYYKLRVVQFFQWADFEATICKETRARAWLGGDDVQALATVAVSDDGSSGESSGDGTITEEDDEEETQEEEESDSSAEDIRAQMIELYGAEIVETASQGEDTDCWDIDTWNDAIEAYLTGIINVLPQESSETTYITVEIKGETIELENPSDVWDLPAAKRGLVIEAILAKTEYKDWWYCGAERGGYFPVIDFQKDSEVVSLKTIDPSTEGYKDGKGTKKIVEYINKLTQKLPIEGEYSRVLDVRIPEGTMEYLDIKMILEEADKAGIKVNIKEF